MEQLVAHRRAVEQAPHVDSTIEALERDVATLEQELATVDERLERWRCEAINVEAMIRKLPPDERAGHRAGELADENECEINISGRLFINIVSSLILALSLISAMDHIIGNILSMSSKELHSDCLCCQCGCSSC